MRKISIYEELETTHKILNLIDTAGDRQLSILMIGIRFRRYNWRKTNYLKAFCFQQRQQHQQEMTPERRPLPSKTAATTTQQSQQLQQYHSAAVTSVTAPAVRLETELTTTSTQKKTGQEYE